MVIEKKGCRENNRVGMITSYLSGQIEHKIGISWVKGDWNDKSIFC